MLFLLSTVPSAPFTEGLESVSLVHKDLTERLKTQNCALYESVQWVLQLNKEERHLRGGAATRKKYHPNTHGSF